MHIDDMIESLYNLDRVELRLLAAEALLISDGPDAGAEMLAEDGGNKVLVTPYTTDGIASFGLDIRP